MAELKVVISEGAQSYALTTQEAQAAGFLGKRIGEVVGGEIIGLDGYTLKIAGGTDKNGFPMRADLPGARQQKILTGEGQGFHPARRGMRDRRTFRGNTISEDTAQVSLVVQAKGAKPLAELLPKKEDTK